MARLLITLSCYCTVYNYDVMSTCTKQMYLNLSGHLMEDSSLGLWEQAHLNNFI